MSSAETAQYVPTGSLCVEVTVCILAIYPQRSIDALSHLPWMTDKLS